MTYINQPRTWTLLLWYVIQINIYHEEAYYVTDQQKLQTYIVAEKKKINEVEIISLMIAYFG